MTSPAPKRRVRRRLLVASVLLVAGTGTFLGIHLDALQVRSWPASLPNKRPVFSDDGRFLAVHTEITSRSRRVFFLDLDNPLDRWLGPRRALDLESETGFCEAHGLASFRSIETYRASFEPAERCPMKRPNACALSANADLLLSTSRDPALPDGSDAAARVAATRLEARRISRPGELLWSRASYDGSLERISPRGRTVAVVTSSGVSLLDGSTGDLRCVVTVPPRQVVAMEITEDCGLVLSLEDEVSSLHSFQLFSVVTGEAIARFDLEPEERYGLMGVCGGRAVTYKDPWSRIGTARLRDVRTGRLLGSWAAVDGATLSPDGTTLALSRIADGRVDVVRVP